MNLSDLESVLGLFGTALSLFKTAKDTLPSGSKKEELEIKLIEIEKALKLADVKAAESLGYELCQCDFPPPIMTAISYDEAGYPTVKCPRCNREEYMG